MFNEFKFTSMVTIMVTIKTDLTDLVKRIPRKKMFQSWNYMSIKEK